MSLRSVSSSCTTSWSIHDSWSESYVGVRHLVYDLLPPISVKTSAEDSALCQLALVGGNHLVEVALYKLLQPFAAAGNGGMDALTKALLEEASYHQMLTRWLPAVSGSSADLQAQPFKSTESLRRRRNATVHKSSAFATVQMARSALFSAVQGCHALFFHASVEFPYESFLVKWPLPQEPWFSEVPHPIST